MATQNTYSVSPPVGATVTSAGGSNEFVFEGNLDDAGEMVANMGGPVTTTQAGDKRAPQVVQVADATTTTQRLAVDANGNIGVASLPALPAGANLIGQVEVTDGANVLGTAAHAVRVDPTGTTPQPVSGTVAISNLPATQPVSGTVDVASLPAGLATSSNQATANTSLGTIATNTGHIPPQGAATTAQSLPVTIASDQTVPTAGASLKLIGGAAVTGVNTYAIPATNASAYRTASLQVVGVFSLGLIIEGSNDNANWTSITAHPVTSTTWQGDTSECYGPAHLVFPITTWYVRVRCTSFTSNTSLAVTLGLFAETTPVYTNETRINIAPVSYGGGTPFHTISAASTNAQNIAAYGAQIYGYDLGNNGTSAAYVKFYDTAGTPTVGTDVPVWVVYLPAGTVQHFSTSLGIPFGSGLGLAITGGAADNDTTAVAANQVVVNVQFYD